MILIKGKNCVVDAKRIVSAFILTQTFTSSKRTYTLKVALSGFETKLGITLLNFETLEKAQKALEYVITFLGKSIDNNVPNQIIDLNNCIEKGDK